MKVFTRDMLIQKGPSIHSLIHSHSNTLYTVPFFWNYLYILPFYTDSKHSKHPSRAQVGSRNNIYSKNFQSLQNWLPNDDNGYKRQI